MPDTAIVDLDGTLVDSNYHHLVAWSRAFRRHGLTPPMWHIGQALGMGGDKLVPAVVGTDVDTRVGNDVRSAWVEEFDRLIDEVQALESATKLLEALQRRGFRVVIASSSQPQHVEHFLDLLGARNHCDAWTAARDVEQTKPAPELLQVALDRVDGRSGVVVGDSPFDFQAAGRLGMSGIGVRTGGFHPSVLRDAGAELVVDSPADLLSRIDETPLARPS